jgi:OOP family OmpA-OmpF porin
VKKFLVGKGIGSERMTVTSMGENQPVTDNSTKDGKFYNRRVEFRILK